MSVLDDDLVLKALQTGFLEAVSLSTTPDMPVKMLGRTFDATKDASPDGRYLELVIIPNNRTGDFWGTEQVYQGLLRIILHWQNDNNGIYEPIRVVKAVASYFSKDRLLPVAGDGRHSLQIYENPSLTGILEEGDKMLYPVSVRYRSFRPAS